MLTEDKDLNNSAVIQVEDLKKSFKVGIQDISVLKGFSFSIKKGDFVVIFGPSGCGKSTLLHIMLGLEEPTSGKVFLFDKNLYKDTDEDMRSDVRKNHLGMVYQMSNWIKSLSVQENVAFPLLLKGLDKPRALQSAMEMLKKVHMENWAKFVPTELSSGQQQRVALARAMINDPEIIIADEPTGNLDFESGQYVMSIFKEMNESMGKTVIMVTHDLEYLVYAKTAIRIADGELVGVFDEKSKEALYQDLKFKRGGDSITGSDNMNTVIQEEKDDNKVLEKNFLVNTGDDSVLEVEKESPKRRFTKGHKSL